MKWDIVYERAVKEDGSLYFPQKLTHEFLDQAKRTMGSYIFANQYLNEIIPAGAAPFKKEWLKYYDSIPERHYTFCAIDPAISESDSADYTGICVVSLDVEGTWYLRLAKRERLNPTALINQIFEIHRIYKPMSIGIEDVAYQRALIHFVGEEMRKRGMVLPVTPIKQGPDASKEMRILSLAPRFEWSRILIARGLNDFELEYGQFPRSKHDDLLDSLSMIEKIAFPPGKERVSNEPPPPNHPSYEAWYRKKLLERAKNGDDNDY